MKKNLIICSMLFLSSNIQGEELNQRDLLIDDITYADSQTKNHELHTDVELELLTLNDIVDHPVMPNNAFMVGDIIMVKLSDDEIQDPEVDLRECKNCNILDSKDDIAYVKGFSLFRKKKQSLKKKKESLQRKARKIRRKLPRKTRH